MKKTYLNVAIGLTSFLVFAACNNNKESQDSTENSSQNIELTDINAGNENSGGDTSDMSANFEWTNFTDEETQDNDGIECNYNFNIDWPENGNPTTVQNVRAWIVKSALGQNMSFTDAESLAEALMDNTEEDGYIYYSAEVKIGEDGTNLNVKCIVDWRAGFSVSSPWGKTTSTAVFNKSTGEIISQNQVGEGEDE